MNLFNFPPFFKAIGHPVRQKILNLLKEQGELPVFELVKQLHLSQSTVSHHLAILKKAGAVKDREEGTQAFYSVCCDQVACCCSALKNFFKR